MWGFWIVLCAAFFTEFCAAESVDLKYGQKLSIKLRDKNNTMEFTSVNRSKSCFVWPKSVQCKRGEVTGFLSKSFTISSVNFDDQGTYTQRNNLTKVISDTKVKVLPSTETQSLKIGQTLTISLSGLSKEEAGLRFSKKDVMLQGSPVPDYSKRMKVTSSSVQLLNVQVSDEGSYTLLDRKSREVKVITLKVTDPCASKITEVPYGHPLNIHLLSQIDSLGFTSVDKSQNYIIWSSSVHPKRGAVKGSGFDRNFIINSVNFEDQGDYTQSNNVSKVICVTKVKVVSK
ncbi:uncharacterized protein [Salminus brasiliensis]|uniref:uncharacterized protein n=1 Tax=Salminus brasiliensis TaxID=930266 RepID=UPI003B82DD30